MFIKSLHDALLEITTALPAAGSNVTSNCFDLLGSGKTDVSNVLVPERIELNIAIPALPNSTSTGDSVSATVMDSDDGTTFAAIPGLAAITIPGVASTGSAASSSTLRFPPTTRRYVAVKYAATSGAGNNTAVNAVAALVF